MSPQEREKAVEFAAYCLEFRTNYLEGFKDPALALVLCAQKERNRQGLIALARQGSDFAHNCLCGMADFLMKIDDDQPRWLQEYIVPIAWSGRTRKGRGRDPFAGLLRNTVIGQSVEMVVQAYGVTPTRNTATDAACGSSLVAEAIRRAGKPHSKKSISERTVARCWHEVWEHERTVFATEQYILTRFMGEVFGLDARAAWREADRFLDSCDKLGLGLSARTTIRDLGRLNGKVDHRETTERRSCCHKFAISWFRHDLRRTLCLSGTPHRGRWKET